LENFLSKVNEKKETKIQTLHHSSSYFQMALIREEAEPDDEEANEPNNEPNNQPNNNDDDEELKELEHENITCLQFSPDLNMASFVTVSERGIVKVWASATRQLIETLYEPEDETRIQNVIWEDQHITAIFDNRIITWNSNNYQVENIIELRV